jgi:hypothetical protein
MALLKRTYSLPQPTIEKFEKAVDHGERSGVVARLLREWLDQRERDRLRREVIEGCRDMADVYLAIEQEFHPLEEEVQHAIDPVAKSRRRGPRPARSGRRVGTVR